MKKLTLLIVLASILQATAISQSCLPEGITFITQAQIDNFQTNYPNCTEIEGDVYIGNMFGGSNISDLTGLSVLTFLNGKLTLAHLDYLAVLTGLENLTSIGGGLSIYDNTVLNDLTALNNLTSIGGNLYISQNESLTSLVGLNNLTSIGGDFWIRYSNLTNLAGLESLASIDGNTIIGDNYYNTNPFLENLNGLEGLSFIGGGLEVLHNDTLAILTGLENLTAIGGNLIIRNNKNLESLTGLENIESSSIDNLYIYDNYSLTNCNIQSICNYIASPFGSVNIYRNAPGCDNPPEIADNCGIILPCLPYGNYHFITQSDIDNFQINYPDCTKIDGDFRIMGPGINNLAGIEGLTSIEGSLSIHYWVEIMLGWRLPIGTSLSNLIGLEGLTYIGGKLIIETNDTLTTLEGLEGLTEVQGDVWISNNSQLDNLNGLENLTFIGGDFSIKRGYLGTSSLTSVSGLNSLTSIGGRLLIDNLDSLTSLTGLEALNTIGSKLRIGGNGALTSLSGMTGLNSIGGDLVISYNEALVNLSGMDALTSIGGYLYISRNDTLTSLSGIDNINPASIESIHIMENKLLSTCEVESVCAYLAHPSDTIDIHSNALGCTSVSEVLDSCLVDIQEIRNVQFFKVYPNPFPTSTTIEYELSQPSSVQFTIYDYLGKQVEVIEKQQAQGKQQIIWNAEGLPAGIYYFRLQAGNQAISGKMVFMK